MAGTSEGQRKGAATRKSKYGQDVFVKMGKTKSPKKGGYFRTLKEQGNAEELLRIARKGAETTNNAKAEERAQRIKNRN